MLFSNLTIFKWNNLQFQRNKLIVPQQFFKQYLIVPLCCSYISNFCQNLGCFLFKKIWDFPREVIGAIDAWERKETNK